MKKFRILIDTGEQTPWTFKGFGMPTKFQYLGTKRDGIYIPRGDYSIDGLVDRIHIERKSGPDMQSTIMGFDGRRDRFERELEFLASCDYSAVICESSLGWVVGNPPARGQKPANVEKKILHRTILSWQMKYRVPFIFCDNRVFAEITAFTFLKKAFQYVNDPDANSPANGGFDKAGRPIDGERPATSGNHAETGKSDSRPF